MMRVLLAALALLATATSVFGQQYPRPVTPGTWIHVEGAADEGGVFAARRVVLQDPLSKPLIRSRIVGAEHGGRRLRLLNFEVTTDTGTTLYRGSARKSASFRELAPGVLVEAKVVRRGKRIVATRIRIEDPGDERAPSIDAPVERVDALTGSIVILGAPFALPIDTLVDQRRGSTSPEENVNVLRRDEDEQQVRPLQIGNAVTIGGRVETTLTDRTDFDLDDRDPDRNQRVDSRVQILASAALTPTFDTYVKVSSARRMPVFDDRAPAAASGDVRVEEAYLTITEPAGLRLVATVGRQRFRDAREWFFDEYLDAARVKTDIASWTVEAAVARAVFRPAPGDREPRDSQHLIASATTRLGDANVQAFLISRRDDSSRQHPAWLGALVTGPLAQHGKYWSLVSVRRGRAGAVRLRGWAVDLGTTWQVPLYPQASITAGFATASGDDHAGDDVDATFRQTELHDNKTRFGGLKRFAYYGEVLRPDLSDLSILTLGVTATSVRKLSLDVMYHRYLHRSAGRWDGDFDIKAAPDHGARHLGDEVDVIVASQAIRGVDLSLIVGVFQPGVAFLRDRSPALVWRPQVRFYF